MTPFSRTLRHALLLGMLAFSPFLELASQATAATPAKAQPAKAQSVKIENFAFVPQVVTVSPGTTVTWTNVDEDPHTVTANDKGFHSAAMDGGDTFSFTFTRPGDFAYFCTLHPHMTGKVIVKG